MRTVLAWTPCAVLLPRLHRSLILIRCARPSSHSLPHLGLGGRVCPSHVRDALRAPLPLICSCGFFPRWSALCSRERFWRRYALIFSELPWLFASLMVPFGLSLWVRPSTVLQARLPWISSRSVHVWFWNLFSLGSRLRTDARLSFTLPANGSTTTVLMRARLHSLLTLPTRSTRSTGRQCCGLSVFISFRLLRGLTAVVVMMASSSLAPPRRLLKSFQQGDPLGPVLFALAIHPIILEARAATEVMYPGVIDICSLIRGFWSIGLEVNLDKTEVILACSSSQSFTPGDFQVFAWVGSSNFKLLGAPLGSSGWCEDLLGRLVGKARTLLTAIGKFPDDQGAFCLLRSCSGWSKVLYSRSIVPPDVHLRGLCDADRDIQSGYRGWWAGGLGARSAAEHAPASYVASFSACRDLCSLLWTGFDPLDLDDGCRFLPVSPPFAAPFRPGPTFMLRVILLRRSPCLQRLRLSRYCVSLLTLPSLGTAVSTSMPAVSLGLAPGLRPVPRLLTPMSPHSSFALLSSAVFVCLLGSRLCVLLMW